MKLPTAYQYRHVFVVLAFLGIGLLCYGVMAMSYPFAWGGIMLTFANGIALHNLED